MYDGRKNIVSMQLEYKVSFVHSKFRKSMSFQNFSVKLKEQQLFFLTFNNNNFFHQHATFVHKT